ncbi:unnamed protein product, partial [Meganyctiphanes norvegica]
GIECFKFSNGMQDWDRAQQDCNLQGDLLAVPSDMNKFLNYIKDHKPPYAQYYIGGRRDDTGEWKWHGGNGAVISGEYWNKDYLNPEPPFSQNKCTTVINGQNGIHKRYCSQFLNYICQHPVNKDSPPYEDIEECYTIPILATLIILLLFLIAGLSVFVYIERRRLQKSLSTNKASALPAKSLVRHDSENSLYGQM